MKTLIALIAASLILILFQAKVILGQDAASCEASVQAGKDFSSARWTLALGDAEFVQADESPITFSDIETLDYGEYSMLRVNSLGRGIMTHNITYLEQIEPHAFDFLYTATFEFRLAHVPTTQNPGPETVEGGLWAYDGQQQNFGTAWQWLVNPWLENDFGLFRIWDGFTWVSSGFHLRPDDVWHSVRVVMDPTHQLASVAIDGQTILSRFNVTPKPTFGTQITAQLVLETVSLNPGENGSGAVGDVYFRNWEWISEPLRCAEVPESTVRPVGTVNPVVSETPSVITGVVQPVQGANLRRSPSTCAQIITTIPVNESVHVVARSSDWLKISWVNSEIGWVLASLLRVEGDVTVVPEETFEPVSCDSENANAAVDCSSVRLDLPPDPAPRSYLVTWSPACAMVLQFYQNGRLVHQIGAASTGTISLNDSRLASGVATEIKIWVAGESIPQDSVFITIS